MAPNERRVRVFCVTCSFAPDDLFFPVAVTAAIKGTWFFFSFAVCIAIFASPGCGESVPTILAVSAAGFAFLQILAFVHKLILLVTSARGTIREPKHRFVRELLLIGVGIYAIEVVWAVYSVVAVLQKDTTAYLFCNELQKPFTAYVVLVWLNLLELALVALVYFSCLDRCKCFCCRAVCVLRCHCCENTSGQVQLKDIDPSSNMEASIKVIPTSHSLSTSQLCSVFRDKCCTCRRDGLNNSKNIALQDLSDALDILYRDIEVHYTVLDRLSGWMLVQKYHSQLMRQGKDSLVNQELLQATLRFLKKKGVISKNHVVREPQPLEEGSTFPDTLLYYYWLAMASYGWTIQMFLDPLSGLCTLCRGARFRCPCTNEEVEEQDGVKEEGMGMFLKAADVASVAGIHVNDIFLGRTANDIHTPPFYVCRTVRRDPVTGKETKEVVITIRGTLSVKDVLTSFTASMRDATKCQESLVEKWFVLLVKTKLKFLGVEDAYFHTGFYKSAKVILNILRKSNLFKDLIEKQHYRVVVTGHSLGAGVGAVLTLLIKHKHPHWAEGLHAYLFSIPGSVCSYELAERAEELGIITSVVGAHDIVPRVSWRALSYLKLLIKKALEETSIKKQEVLCCGNLPNWNPPIFGGSTFPVGLVDKQSGATTPDFLELQESLPIIRSSTWDQEAIKKKKREKRRMERGLVEDEDVEYHERRRTDVDNNLDEVRKRLQHAKRVDEEAKIKLGPVVIAPVEEHSDDKRGKTRMDAERVERVATSFLQEKSRLGPLMFIPGQVLHLEEGEKDCDGASAGWCGVEVLGLRCCGVRCVRDKPIRASWKAREDFTGVILHRDSLVDHSPRRTFGMLRGLKQQMDTQRSTDTPVSAIHSLLSSEKESGERPSDEVKPLSVVVVDSKEGNAPSGKVSGHGEGHYTVSVELHEQSEL